MLSEHGGKILFISCFILPLKNPIEKMAGRVSRDAMTQMLTICILQLINVFQRILSELSFANNV